MVFLAKLILFSALYYFSGKLGLSMAVVQSNATVVWPPSGIALAGLLIFGWRLWPGVFLGAFLVNATTTSTPILASLGIATGNTLEALAGSFLVLGFCGGRGAFDQTKNIFKFLFFAATVSTAISATFGVTSLTLHGLVQAGKHFSVFATWWLGDMVSVVILTPLLLIWSSKSQRRFKQHFPLEAVGLTFLVFVAGQIVFGGWLPTKVQTYPIEYLVIPPLLLTAFRHGKKGASLAVLGTSILAIRGTLNGFGPFASHGPHEALLLLQAFMGTTTLLTLVVATVIAERRLTEETLIHQTRELEQFAYVASHDLREPLRKISSYVELLALRLDKKLDGMTEQYVKVISESVERMNALIGDLLNYSRLTKEKVVTEKVILADSIKNVITDLEPLMKEAQATVKYEGLDSVRAQPSQVYQLLQNLISNAIKFKRLPVPPVVQISSQKNAGMVEISVEDNGIGIASQYHEQVFRVFQRLHSRDKYPGTGIGLAICKKIVEQNGGRIWIESELGKGTIFRFTMPSGN